MGHPLPKPTTRNLSAGLKYTDAVEQGQAELAFALVFSDDFDGLTAWTETDADGKVNLVGGEVQMDGGESWNTHGIVKTVGFARAAGYLQWDWCPSNSGWCYHLCGTAPAAALSTARAGCIQQTATGAAGGLDFNAFGDYNFFGKVLGLVAGTWYTIRAYVLKGTDGLFNKARVTIQGGAFTDETEIGAYGGQGTIWAATIYPQFQRHSSDPPRPMRIRLFRWFSGYSVAGETDERIYDAGADHVFQNLDLTSLIEGGSVPSTNLLYAWSFDDGAADYSAWHTLAALNAHGKQTANHRYIRLKTQVNSDGATQAVNVGLNAAAVIDGVFVLPTAGDILTGVTINTVAGDTSNLTAANAKFLSLETGRNVKVTPLSAVPSPANGGPAAWTQLGDAMVGTGDKVLSLADEASRNTDPGVSHVDVDVVASYKIQNVTKTPTLSLSAEKTAYENARNNDNGTVAADIIAPATVKIRNVTITGAGSAGSTTTGEVVVDIVEAVAGD